MSLLRAEGIGHGFGERAVLEDVTVEVEAGEVLALIGPNGAGKSTLLSVLAGDLTPGRGTVRVGERAPSGWSPMELARRRSVLLQNSQVAFSYPVEEIVAMGRTPWKGTPLAEEDDRACAEALETTRTRRLRHRDVTTLSGGENGRVQLARVLAQRTPLILLDEPTAALDILHQEETLRTCRELAAAGAGVVVVLHDLDVAAAYADRIILLERGRIVAQGTPEQVCTSRRLTEVYGWDIEVLRHPVSGRLLVLPRR